MLVEAAVGGPRASACWDGTQLLAALRAAASWVERHVEQINQLNVFPVPDGDTGTNLALTLSGALAEVVPHASCAVVADAVRYRAIMAGRGNSGIILSQVLRGVAQALAGHERMCATQLAAALAQGSRVAYTAVIAPVEGTMLTVAREAAEAAQAAAATGASLLATLEVAARAAHEAVQRTPQLLQTLRDAGVVDAGGQGLALLLQGMLRYARGEPAEPAEPSMRSLPQVIKAETAYGYCTNFVILGSNLPFAQVRTTLAALGQSVVVAGDDTLIKVHLHTMRPGDALNYAVGVGTLAEVQIQHMDAQIAHAPIAAAEGIGIVAVAPGAGLAAIFTSLGVGAVIDGGLTMNPSAAELLAALERLPQAEVLLLPNHPNIYLAATQAAALSNKQTLVLPTHNAPQGLAALQALNLRASLAANQPALDAALLQVATAELTHATRDTTLDGLTVRAGQVIGLLDGRLISVGDSITTVLDAMLVPLGCEDGELASIYYGQGVSAGEAAVLASRLRQCFPALQVEVYAGGQAIYDYIISVE